MPWSVFAALALLWVVASVVLLLWAAEPTLTFLGDIATVEERALHESRLALAFAGSTLLAVAGLALGIRGRRPGWGVVFGTILLAIGAAWVAVYEPVGSPPPADDGPRPCVEHSGADNRCPGG